MTKLSKQGENYTIVDTQETFQAESVFQVLSYLITIDKEAAKLEMGVWTIRSEVKTPFKVYTISFNPNFTANIQPRRIQIIKEI